MKYSYLIVGAGYTGAVIAREIAEKCNEPVLVIDRRNHVSGNAFDHNDKKESSYISMGPIFSIPTLYRYGNFYPGLPSGTPTNTGCLGKSARQSYLFPLILLR